MSTLTSSLSGSSTLPPLYFNVAIAGDLPPTSPRFSDFQNQISSFFFQLNIQVSQYNRKIYGFCEEPTTFQVLFSQDYGTFALKNAMQNGFVPYCVAPFSSETAQRALDEIGGEASKHLITFNMDPKFPVMANRETANWIIEQSDLVLAVWDGTESFGGGCVWDMILQADEKKVPVIWFDVNSPDQVYWNVDHCKSPYKTEALEQYLEQILGLGSKSKNAPELKDLEKLANSQIPPQSWWTKSYERFVRLFKAPASFPESRPAQAAEYRLPELMERPRAAAEIIKFYFQQADLTARLYNDRYRSAILLRAILPFIANLALAVGFYATSLGRPVFPQVTWEWVAAAGFLFQAFFTYSMYWLSKADENNRWQRTFLEQRYIAEALRMALHFQPLNIPVNSAILPRFDNKAAQSAVIRHRIRSIVRAAGIPAFQYDMNVKDLFYNVLETLLDQQHAYQTVTMERNKQVNKVLNRWATAMFIVGILIVIVRAVIQILLQVYCPEQAASCPLMDVYKSGANMPALLLPAFALMFNSIIGFGGFDTLYQRSENMVNNLERLQKVVQNEKERKESSFEDYCRVTRQTVWLLLGEAADWYAIIGAKRITKN